MRVSGATTGSKHCNFSLIFRKIQESQDHPSFNVLETIKQVLSTDRVVCFQGFQVDLGVICINVK